MKPSSSNRFWNRFILGALVLCVAGAAMCSVAASAAQARCASAGWMAAS